MKTLDLPTPKNITNLDNIIDSDPAKHAPDLVHATAPLIAKWSTLFKAAATLRAMGITDAKPHYRNGECLYLVHPMTDGNRQRQYIGNDPIKKEEALEAVKRFDHYERLAKQANIIARQIARLYSDINDALHKADSINAQIDNLFDHFNIDPHNAQVIDPILTKEDPEPDPEPLPAPDRRPLAEVWTAAAEPAHFVTHWHVVSETLETSKPYKDLDDALEDCNFHETEHPYVRIISCDYPYNECPRP